MFETNKMFNDDIAKRRGNTSSGCRKIKEDNKLFWHTEYDYFYGGLLMSPDRKRFLSAGWVWGSVDCCKVYETEDFITNHRIKDKTICFEEHNDRGICFVDNETIAAVLRFCLRQVLSL